MIPFALKKLIFYSYKKGMMKMLGCIFCQIAARQKPATIYHEDDQCVVFQDINAKAPIHMLVVPRKHIASLNEAEEEGALLGHLLVTAARVAKQKGIDGTGFRTVINTNAEAGQTVFHLHVHLLGGRILRWPPG
jgi:histidine triad (HIT) family protein